VTTQQRELVAVAHQAFVMDEASLKQLVTMFNRVAIPALSVALTQTDFITPEFAQNRVRLAEAGILFEPDLDASFQDPAKILDLIRDDVNQLIMPTIGLSMDEMIAAREDKEKLSEINERSVQASARLQSEMESGSLDPEKLWELGRRVSVNLARIVTIQIRQAEHLNAYAVIPGFHSSLDQDDPNPTKHDVVKIVFAALPVPDVHVPWDQIIDYRSDPESQTQFLDIKGSLCELATGSLTPVEAEEKIGYLLNQYRKQLERHAIKPVTNTFEAFVVTTADFPAQLADFESPKLTALFSLEHRKLGMLDDEPTAPGSAVAFVTGSDFVFPA
jgi:hypothetical protein